MTCTEQLREEHSAILIMLDILAAMCGRIERDEPVESGHFERIHEFARVFVDSCHHGKEEDLLFPAMLESGITESGLISVLKREHEAERSFVRGFAEGIADYPSGSREARAAIIRNARSFRTLITQHIRRENNILYPLADARLSAESQDRLREQCEELERDRIGPGRHEEFHRLLKELKAVYLA